MRTKSLSKAIEEIPAPKPEARPRIYAYSIQGLRVSSFFN